MAVVSDVSYGTGKAYLVSGKDGEEKEGKGVKMLINSYIFSLDMLEKIEPPTSIPPGYGISVAYATLLDIVRSISLAIQGPSVVSFGDFEGNRDLI